MKNILKATHQGPLNLGKNQIMAYVLENGERVLSRIEFMRAIGRTGKAKGGRKYDKEFKLPVFLTAKNLEKFIDDNLRENSKPINFIDLSGKNSIGYQAILLPKVCYVFIDAQENKELSKNQLHIYQRSKELVRAFAITGIIALVDEATGYQYDRERNELQKILKAYISEELLPWQKRFPDMFYKELFRLNKWDFTVKGIKKRPGVVGKWTNTLIYKQLPKGVLEELKRQIPKTKTGRYAANLHRKLTIDVGHPNLSAQINQVLAIFTISDNMKEMWSNFEKMNMRKNGQLELPFEFNDKGITIEPIEISQLSTFNKKLKKGLEYNPKINKN